MGSRAWISAVCLPLAICLAVPLNAGAQVDPSTTDLPVLSAQVPRGTSTPEAGTATAPIAKTIDGDISDWTGTASSYGGTLVYSGGELVYQDHLFDALGADDGRDAERLGTTDPAQEVYPELYRVDALAQADPSGELGIPVPDEYHYDDTYGDAALQDEADLLEVRLAQGAGSLDLLARTTTMKDQPGTALLLLVDAVDGGSARAVPFDSGLSTESAEYAVFLAANGVARVADLSSGDIADLPAGSVAANPAGYTNALEARVPLDAIGSPANLVVALASGTINGDGSGFAPLTLEMNNEIAHPNVANVAFRTTEPVRVWFDVRQALALHAGSIDDFFVTVDGSKLASGANETLMPGPGYHDRIFVSTETISGESSRNGIYQHYGLFIPTGYDPATPAPLQWWLHWRGGTAHSGGAIVPRVFKHYGENWDTVVVAPYGRGTGRWYVGKGHVDFLEVWDDVHETVNVDPSRVYVSGHSMGGWGTYLLTLLYPDRFAAGAPAAGPVTQGAWTGVDFPGCDSFQFDEYTPCYISANGSRPRDQFTRKILENSRHVPYAILHGTDDELVPYSGVARQAERLQQLGYQFRLYTYPGYEHYSHPIMDQWAEAARYMHSFTRPENPRTVSYKRDMLFEKATEEVQSDGVPLSFDFDKAYWMSELTPVDMEAGTAYFEGSSLAIAEAPYRVIPDVGGPASPGATGPYFFAGQRWLTDPLATAPAAQNGFTATLQGTVAVRLDLDRMQIDPLAVITGTVTTDAPLDLRLDGDWASAPTVLVGGQPVIVTFADGVVSIPLPAGSAASAITVTPAV